MNFNNYFNVFAALSVVCLCTNGQINTGVKVRVSKAGLNYGAGIAVDLLAERIGSARIPDLSGSGFELKNIRITRFDKPSPDVVLNQGSGLLANLNNAAVTVEANWKYSVGKGWFKIRDSGRLTLSSSRFSIGSALNIGKDAGGRPTASASSCSCSIGGFVVRFHGGISVIYNLFARLFENKIRNKLQDLTCDEVIKLINTNVKDELASLNVDAKIHSGIQLDYRLSENPVFTSEYLETSHVGEFFSGSIRSPVLPGVSTFNTRAPLKMATISLSDRVFNSGGYLLQKLGKFNFSQEMKASEINDFLELPNERLSFELEASSPPRVHINASGLRCNITAFLRLQTNPPNQPPTLLCAFQLGLLVHIDVNIEAGNIKGKFISVEPTVITTRSALAKLPAPEIQQALQYILGLILPGLNEEASKGFPLPQLDFVAFRDAEMTTEEGVASVSTNVVSNQ